MPNQILFLLVAGIILLLRCLQTYPYQPVNFLSSEIPSNGFFVERFEAIRGDLSQKILEILPEPQSGLLAGMVLGVKAYLPPDFKEELRKTSTIHVVVVSGQNLTLLAGFLMSIAPLIGRKKAIVVSLVIVSLYSLLTGLQVPVLRALMMVILGYFAQITGREKESWWIISLTGVLMLIYNPAWLFSISFQLSYLATVGVVIVAPEITNRIKFIPNLIRQDLAVSTAAHILTLPVIASNFHQISIIGILVNTLILFTVPLIMISGIITIVASLINPVIGSAVSIVPNILLTYFVYVINFFSQLNWASIPLGKISILFWMGYYLIIISLVWHLKLYGKQAEL